MGRLIDEDDAIEALIEEGWRSKRYKLGETWELNLDEIRKAIATVPTAQQEPKIGKWVDDGDPLMITCGNCGYDVMRYNNTPFCPNCGAKMEKIYDCE